MVNYEPKPRIYTSWLEANRVVINIDVIIHRLFTYKIEAEGNYANYKVSKLSNIVKNYSIMF